MRCVEAKAPVDTLTDAIAKGIAGTPCITLAHIKLKVLITTLANRLGTSGV